MFRRQQHNDILHALRSFNSDLLLDAECYFGGGTAIVLNLDEYRESVDIDFLCASREGYRKLREVLWGVSDISPLLLPKSGIQTIREVRTDHYGIRCVIGARQARIKFEIVREARISLMGELDPRFGVPVLGRDFMYAEKLLANADRWNDQSVLSRDILDLSMMISRWGPIPETAWHIAEKAYGNTAREAYEKAILCIRDPKWLRKCTQDMAMTHEVETEILNLHGGPIERT